MLAIMEKYGWDYYTYMNQPNWLLDLAQHKLSIENKMANKAAEQPE